MSTSTSMSTQNLYSSCTPVHVQVPSTTSLVFGYIEPDTIRCVSQFDYFYVNFAAVYDIL